MKYFVLLLALCAMFAIGTAAMALTSDQVNVTLTIDKYVAIGNFPDISATTTAGIAGAGTWWAGQGIADVVYANCLNKVTASQTGFSAPGVAVTNLAIQYAGAAVVSSSGTPVTSLSTAAGVSDGREDLTYEVSGTYSLLATPGVVSGVVTLTVAAD